MHADYENVYVTMRYKYTAAASHLSLYTC